MKNSTLSGCEYVVAYQDVFFIYDMCIQFTSVLESIFLIKKKIFYLVDFLQIGLSTGNRMHFQLI